MSDTHSESVAFVRDTFIPEQPAPSSATGVVKWLQDNLFPTWLNGLLTVVSIFVIYKLLASTMPWMLNGLWNTESLAACREVLDGTTGACFSVITERWNQIQILGVKPESVEGASVGGQIEISAEVNLNALQPGDVDVEIFYGSINDHGIISEGDIIRMNHKENRNNGTHLFTGTLPFKASGRHGYTVRVLPTMARQSTPHELALIHWA